MRYFYSVLLLCCLSVQLLAQNGQNPFDLGGNEQETSASDHAVSAPDVNQNPFDLQKEKNAVVSPIKTEKQNPFDLAQEQRLKEELPPQQVRNKTTAQEPTTQELQSTNGWILTLVFIVLALAALMFIFFRSLYNKVYRAIFNDNQLSLLYRERAAGALGSFLITYLLFFLSTALFIYLALHQFDLLDSSSGVIQTYFKILLGLTSVFVAKHAFLALMAYIFPIYKEMSSYSFTIMVFAIALGIMMPFADLVLAYSPASMKLAVVYFVAAIVFILYGLRSLRGFFIANRFLMHNKFHFLLYLCAVEMAPALILYKLLLNN